VKRPDVNALVTLTVPSVEGELHSRVEDLMDDGSILIAEPSGEDVHLATGSDLQIEWRLRSGVARQTMTVVKHVDNGIASVLIKPQDEPKVIQRRDFIRIDVLLTVFIETHLGQEGKGTTVDVSGGGMRAVVPFELADGQTVDFGIVLPEQEREVRGKAQTIRKVAEDTYAFGFAQIPEADRERLIKFVFARQQSLLRQGKLTA
jgi:c-di-GMP-binding flagellar brake protein YcgR